MEEKIRQNGTTPTVPTIFQDPGSLIPEQSLAYFENIRDSLEGTVIRIEAQRGTPDVIYNTRLYTDRNEEIWLSGFTCGKQHAGALGLCELIAMVGWDKYVPREEITKLVLSNNSFRMEFKGRDVN